MPEVNRCNIQKSYKSVKKNTNISIKHTHVCMHKGCTPVTDKKKKYKYLNIEKNSNLIIFKTEVNNISLCSK